MKTCRICKKEIKKKDNYVELVDYKEGELLDRGYYHNSCYHNQIDNAIIRNKEKLKGMLPGMIKGLTGRKLRNNDKEIVISTKEIKQ